MTDRAPRILRRDELDRMRRADAILREAESHRRQSEEDAARNAQSVLTEAKRKALKESAQAASRVIVQAEAAAEQRLRALEPELARMVAATVRRIIGEMQPEEAAYHAALTALRALRDHRRSRIFAAPDMSAPVARAAGDAGAQGPEIIGLHEDPALEPGRAVLTSDHGSTEIGLAAITDHALKAWEDGGNGGGRT